MDVFERRVLDALPLTVYTVDLEGRITSANRSWSQFARANGAPALAEEQSLVGASLWSALADPGAREQVERAMELLRSGRSQAVTWEFPCSSPGEERVFLMQISPLHDGHTVSGYVFSTVNITPSHRSREALIDAGIALSRPIALDRAFQEVAQQIRRAIPHDAIAIAVADDSTATLHVAHSSGYEDGIAATENRLSSIWQGAVELGAVVVHHADGGMELTAPMTSSERVLGAITVRADTIDSHQRLDEARRVLATIAAQTAAAIERASLVRRVEHKRRLEAIGEVAAGVAHELRNPLFGISSAAQLLRFRAREDPVVEKNVGRILREVERLNRMATELLEFGRPSSLTVTTGDPDAVWDDVLEGERGRLESRSLQLHRTRSESPARCAIDAEQLTQVFVNVLLNAVDAAPEASDLTLVTTVLPTGAWRCRLHNGGPPMPSDALRRAFEIFFSTKAGGTGIGLALCQRIIDEHHGTIALESGAESGTTVTIVLPPAA
ncbi:MAG: PAS domain-containing protein [Gemmatimonadaceae bacterium]|nr:PAS domain-containing protein [Gemmatimonadaceae bacterium]